MYKRVALFSSDLFVNSLHEQNQLENIENQLDQFCEEDFSDNHLEYSDELSNPLINNQNTATQNSNYTDSDFIGKFKCLICPKKIIINEIDLDKHLKSKQHLSKVDEWKKKQESARRIREKFNILHNLVDENEVLPGNNSNEEGCVEIKATAKPRVKRKNKRQKCLNLTEEQIIAKKMKFIRKKERRLARKSMLTKSSS